MMISTRGRYALRVLLDLAENQTDGYIAMKKVAERQDLSLKYIEKIMPVLSKNKYSNTILIYLICEYLLKSFNNRHYQRR